MLLMITTIIKLISMTLLKMLTYKILLSTVISMVTILLKKVKFSIVYKTSKMNGEMLTVNVSDISIVNILQKIHVKDLGLVLMLKTLLILSYKILIKMVMVLLINLKPYLMINQKIFNFTVILIKTIMLILVNYSDVSQPLKMNRETLTVQKLIDSYVELLILMIAQFVQVLKPVKNSLMLPTIS